MTDRRHNAKVSDGSEARTDYGQTSRRTAAVRSGSIAYIENGPFPHPRDIVPNGRSGVRSCRSCVKVGFLSFTCPSENTSRASQPRSERTVKISDRAFVNVGYPCRRRSAAASYLPYRQGHQSGCTRPIAVGRVESRSTTGYRYLLSSSTCSQTMDLLQAYRAMPALFQCADREPATSRRHRHKGLKRSIR